MTTSNALAPRLRMDSSSHRRCSIARLRAVCLLLIATLLLLGLSSCGGSADQGGASARKPRFAFVTNCAVEFWAVAEAGVQAAAAELDVDVLVRMPPNGTPEEQKRMLEDVVSAGVQGIAVSPKDPDNMTGLLDDLAQRVPLITQDSDAPNSQRLCFIGVDNYDAGRMCGELIAEAQPDGGPVVLLVGTLDQDNGRRRRQGVVDYLLERSRDPNRFDAVDAELQNDRWEIRATFTDQLDARKAKSIAEDALARWSDIAVMVGLFEHEAPVILDAVRGAGRLGSVAIVSFDENQRTLQGIADGHIHGTVVQNPYEYGYQSIAMLAKLAAAGSEAERRALLPKGGILPVPAKQIRRPGVAAFRQELDKLLGR
ncbi:MAG: substrate-binding domain-containing protein [Planctomycetota bacterium]